MTLDAQSISAIAERVLHAQDHAQSIPKLTDEFPDLTPEDSYAVQDEMRRRREARGERVVGRKAGLTSKAKMQQMGVNEPSFGILTSAMARPENGVVETDQLIHPRVEPEIAFVTAAEMAGEDLSIDEVIRATAFLLPAAEIIDSRYERFKFDLVSAIADNGSSARYVTGGWPRKPQDVDLRTLGVALEKNGEVMTTGAGAAVLDHPANAVAMLVSHLTRRGETLPAGSFVLTGGITEAVPVEAGDSIVIRYQNMGSVSVRFA